MSPKASHRVRPGLSSAASLMTTLLISFDQEVLNQQLTLVTPEYPFFESPWMRTKQRYRCKACGLNFTDTPARGKPLALKAAAVLLYVSGLSMNRTAKLLGVSTPTIQAWLEQFAAAYAQKPEPEGRAVVIELDEMWHYLKKVRAALGLEGLGSCFRPAGGLGMRRS